MITQAATPIASPGVVELGVDARVEALRRHPLVESVEEAALTGIRTQSHRRARLHRVRVPEDLLDPQPRGLLPTVGRERERAGDHDESGQERNQHRRRRVRGSFDDDLVRDGPGRVRGRAV